jgi:thioredoxin-like negative regulator of GroEL
MTIKYFSANWCQPCKSFGPLLVDYVSKADGFELVKLDVDTAFEETVKYNIRSVPTMVFEDNGVTVKIVPGVKTETQLNELFQSITSHENKN